jgi:hypothetical protein
MLNHNTEIIMLKRKAELPANTPIASGVESITPELAVKYLDSMVSNRNLQMALVRRLARAISVGQWTLGQPILFDEHGQLMDGQHRLRAVILSGEAVDFVVLRGLEARVMAHIDIGKGRSLPDLLKMAGYNKNTAALACIVRAIVCMERGAKNPIQIHNTQPYPTHDDLIQRIQNDAQLRRAVKYSVGRMGPLGRLMRSQAAFGWLIYCALVGLDNFSIFENFVLVAIGSKPPTADDDPAWKLCQRLTRPERATRKTPAVVRTGLTVKAWNAYCYGMPIRTLVYRPVGAGAEPFPIIELDSEVAAANGEDDRSEAE